MPARALAQAVRVKEAFQLIALKERGALIYETESLKYKHKEVFLEKN